MSVGAGLVGLGWWGVRRGERWALVTAASMTVIAYGIALPLHYVYGLATLGQVGPFYVVGSALIAGFALAARARQRNGL